MSSYFQAQFWDEIEFFPKRIASLQFMDFYSDKGREKNKSKRRKKRDLDFILQKLGFGFSKETANW